MSKIQKILTTTLLIMSLCLSMAAGYGLPAAAAEAAPPPEAETVTAPETETLLTLDEIMEADERVWRYLDDPRGLAQIQDAAWTAPGYDDSGWLTAAGSFGAYRGRLDYVGEEYLPDVYLRHYLPDGSTVPTYYFRLVFTAHPSSLTEPLQADILYDDAAIMYLNGKVIFSGNVPPEGYAAPNAYGCAAAYEKLLPGTVTVDGSQLLEGENVLCVELHQSDGNSSDIFFSLGDLCYGSPENDALRNDTLNLGVGADETQMLVTWRGPIREDAYVQVEPWDAGHKFTDAAAVYPAERCYESEDDDICTYRAVITGLAPGQYIYRAVDEYPTRTGSFTVADPGSQFSFLCHGDPQIMDENDESVMEVYETLAAAAMGGETPQLVLSLGDQVNDRGNEDQYRLFTNTPLLKAVPLAAIVGNHETDSREFSRVFSLPNVDEATEGDSGDMSGDYWFFRGNTLFLCLNSNCYDTEAHRAFLQEARETCVEQYGEPVWTVAAFHHSLFSIGEHAASESIIERRGPYTAMLEEAGVDVVFSGHDHTYTRSWPMDGETPLSGSISGGIMYFSLGSSTGSKFYDAVGETPNYAAISDGNHYPAMSRVDVTDSTFTVTTYQLQGDTAVLLDTYQLQK